MSSAEREARLASVVVPERVLVEGVDLSAARGVWSAVLEGMSESPSWLSRLARHHYGSGAQPFGAAYDSPEALLADAGRFFAPAERVLPAGEPHECASAALSLAAEQQGVSLVQGIASFDGRAPVLHTWCADVQGRVLDPTWGPAARTSCYLGVVVPLSLVMALHTRAALEAQRSGADRVSLQWFTILTPALLERPYDLAGLQAAGDAQLGGLRAQLEMLGPAAQVGD